MTRSTATLTRAAVPRSFSSRPRIRLGWLAVAAAAFAGGVVLAGLGARVGSAGPLVMVLAPVALLGAAAILARPALGVAAVFLSFPVGFVALPVGSLDIKVVEAMAAVAVGLIVLRRISAAASPLPWAPQMWWGLGLVAMALVATPGALDGTEALKQDGLLAVGFLFALAIPAAIRSMRELRGVVGVLLAVGTGIAAYGFKGVSHLQASFGGTVVTNRAQGLFAQPNELGAFSAAMMMLAIGLLLGARSGWVRMAAAVAVVVDFVALALSLSRGAWMGTAFAAAVLLAVLPQARRALLSVGLPVLIVAAVAVSVFLPASPLPGAVKVVEQRIGTLTHPTIAVNPYDIRPQIWHEAELLIQEHPWTGIGPGNFPVATELDNRLPEPIDHAHDVLLTVAAEVGIPGALALIGLTLALALLARRVVRGFPDPLDRAVLAGIAAALATQIGHGVVDFILRNAVLFLLMWALAGMLLAAGRLLDQEEPA
ncbi:MAG: O-antigen ligase family protein [Actinomycetota bacterium]|nr:O-antigen ligase family protein [Actinomycetota bacterium]